MKKIIFPTIIIIQIIAIVFIYFQIREKQNKVLSAVSVNPMKEEEIVFSPDDELQYFYESNPGIQKEKPEWLPDEATYTINSDSLNERYEYSVEKTPKTFRIITIGDSHTFGQYINTKDNYPEQLEDLLNQKKCNNYSKFEVINLGMKGYDLLYAIHRFETRGLKYDSDLVLWYVKDDDFETIFELTFKETSKLKKELNLQGDSPSLDDLMRIYKINTEAAINLLNKLSKEKLLSKQEEILKGFPESYKGKILIFTYSFLPKIYREIINNFISFRPNTYLNDEIEYKEIDRLPDSHPSKLGYTFVVKNLNEQLFKLNLINCD